MRISFRHTRGEDAVVIERQDRSDICPQGVEISAGPTVAKILPGPGGFYVEAHPLAQVRPLP